MSEEKKTSKVEEGVPNITLSTGVELKPQEIPPGVFIRIVSQDPRPKPPMYSPPNKPNILIPNFDDEIFIKDTKQWEYEQQQRLLFSMTLYGIDEIVKVPRGIEKHTSDDWINKMRYTGAEVFPDDKNWRQATWVLEVAAKTADDFNAILLGVGRLSGVPEEDVQNAAQFSERQEGS
jgi:hypothetical protein